MNNAQQSESEWARVTLCDSDRREAQPVFSWTLDLEMSFWSSATDESGWGVIRELIRPEEQCQGAWNDK